jgi:simple sugar transport system substrate-binding protein
MNKYSRRGALTLMGASLAATQVNAQSTPKIAFVMAGQPGNNSWYFEHQRGVDAAQAAFGNRSQIDAFYDVPEWGNGDREAIQELVDDDYSLIFTCSSGYIQSTFESALANPQTRFEHCGGYIRAQNMSTYSIRWYEGRTIEGTLAGHMTKTNKIGYIATFPIAQVIRGINAAFLAARKVNPVVEMEVIWMNEWFNPAGEAEAARELAARGVDVVMTHANTSEHIKVAEELGIYSLGKSTDRAALGPNSVLTSSVNDWGPYYVRRVGAFLDNAWQSKETWGGLNDQMLTMAPINGNVPSRATLQTTDIINSLTNAETSAFTGPIRRQDGSGWLAAGETAGDSDLLTMNFFVSGITSAIPTSN